MAYLHSAPVPHVSAICGECLARLDIVSSHATCIPTLYLSQRATAKPALIDMSVGLRIFLAGTVLTIDIDDLDDQTYPGSQQHMGWER